MKLLLFDIDGTILHTHGSGRRLVDSIFLELTGRTAPARISYAGKTDPQIAMEMAHAVGCPESERDEVVQRSLELYTQRMLDLLPASKVTLLPGAAALIDRLCSKSDVQLALLTGNVEPIAFAKLAAVGVDKYFTFGAFGSDSPDRYRLPPIAQQRALDITGHLFEKDNIVIIGDTEHDIRCGRSIGAYSVGVCTGYFGRDELSRHEPNALFDTLEDADHFERTVLLRVSS
ncbi:MAG: HAD family hydrolase [Rhodothermales bacterium]